MGIRLKFAVSSDTTMGSVRLTNYAPLCAYRRILRINTVDPHLRRPLGGRPERTPQVAGDGRLDPSRFG